MKRALVLGGTHDHIRLIKLLKDKSYEVILFDYFPNPVAKDDADVFYQISTTDINAVLEKAKELDINLVASSSIESSLFTSIKVAELLNLPSHITVEQASISTNKIEMKQMFKDQQIPSAPFIVKDNDSIADINGLLFPLVVKPIDSNSSKGVNKVNSIEEFKSAFDNAISFSLKGKVIVEEFVEGRELSVDLFIKDGFAKVLMVSETKKSEINQGKFTITQSTFPVSGFEKLNAQFEEIGTKIAKASGIQNSPLLIQVLENSNGISVIEYSARLGGGSKHEFVKAVTGIDIQMQYLNLLENEKPTLNLIETSKVFSMVYLYALKGTIQSIDGLEELKASGKIIEFFKYKSDLSVINGFETSSDRPAGYLISADNFEQLEASIKACNQQIHVYSTEGVDLLIRSN